MSEQKFKRWMIAKTRQYIWLIFHMDPDRVTIAFKRDFKKEPRYLHQSHGYCTTGQNYICYRTDYINDWDCNLKSLETLVIHEVCHLAYSGHPNAYWKLYTKWSGDDYIERIDKGIVDIDHYVSGVVGLPHVK